MWIYLRKFKQAQELANSERCKAGVAAGVKLIADSDFSLPKTAKLNLPPPPVFGLPLQLKMTCCRSRTGFCIGNKIHAKLKGFTLSTEKIGLLLRGRKHLLCWGFRSGKHRVARGSNQYSCVDVVFHG